jgi:hypothetical protein
MSWNGFDTAWLKRHSVATARTHVEPARMYPEPGIVDPEPIQAAKTGRDVIPSDRMALTSEHEEQKRLIRMCAAAEDRWPELALLYAIPNGGQRSRATAGKLRAEGVRPGVPDLCLPVSRGGFHGLYIELKTKRNRPTPEQTAWLDALEAGGYAVRVCWGADAAWSVIAGYLEVTT